MASGKKRVKEGRLSERRNRRSGRLADALRLQLEVCREKEGLSAIVVSDELGFCVAHSGGDGNHDELAARLPMLADPAQHDLLDEDDGAFAPPGSALAVTTFSIAGARLHACAVKQRETDEDTSEPTAAILARVASGFTRLLAQ
jgi:hypothetical protein